MVVNQMEKEWSKVMRLYHVAKPPNITASINTLYSHSALLPVPRLL